MAVRKNMKSSFMKEYFYVQAFLSEPIEVEFPWGKETIAPPKLLNISETLFARTYSCMDYFPCRKCCIGLWSLFLKDFTLPEVAEKIAPHSVVETIKVAGKDLEYYCIDHKGSHCPMSDLDLGCTVHIGNPITCMFPLVHFRQYRKENINILLAHFGRNWAMGCPVVFEPTTVALFNERVLPRFERLIEYLDFINVPHKGKKILDKICKRRDEVLGKKVAVGFGFLADTPTKNESVYPKEVLKKSIEDIDIKTIEFTRTK